MSANGRLVCEMTITISSLAETAALMGEPARTAMLFALMDGRAFTATELAGVAGVLPQTASGHLCQLLDAGMLAVEKQGRHRYFRLATPEIAAALEALLIVTDHRRDGLDRTLVKTPVVGPRDKAVRAARICYDHLAGRLGVGIFQSMVATDQIRLTETGTELTDAGYRLLSELGAPPDPSRGIRKSAMACRPCLDWSERRSHLAGRAGSTICDAMMRLGWIRRVDGSRAVTITESGGRAIAQYFPFAS